MIRSAVAVRTARRSAALLLVSVWRWEWNMESGLVQITRSMAASIVFGKMAVSIEPFFRELSVALERERNLVGGFRATKLDATAIHGFQSSGIGIRPEIDLHGKSGSRSLASVGAVMHEVPIKSIGTGG
jgi:hypothetical protein